MTQDLVPVSVTARRKNRKNDLGVGCWGEGTIYTYPGRVFDLGW